MNQDREKMDGGYHRPVLVDEVVTLLAPVLPGVVIDATFGGGGHSRRLLDEFGGEVTVVGIDRDPDALENARGMGVVAVEGNFGNITELVRVASRGFSYRHDGPLDMRMGPDAPFTAAEVVNTWSEAHIARIIREYGEEPMARRIARAIVAARPFDSTARLSTAIAEAMPAARRRAGHPARRTFQAIRIAVNGELDALREGIDQAIGLVGVSGRIVAISYHSLEDRIVKRRLVEGATGCTCPPDLPVCGCGNTAELRILTRKPVRASQAEIEANNRSRSAVLRAAERLAA
jgi:16S rRNA (cytosine1402-N4)-methyltransferase